MKIEFNVDKQHLVFLIISIIIVAGIGFATAQPLVWHPLQSITRTAVDLTSVDADGDGVIDRAEVADSITGRGGSPTEGWQILASGSGKIREYILTVSPTDYSEWFNPSYSQYMLVAVNDLPEDVAGKDIQLKMKVRDNTDAFCIGHKSDQHNTICIERDKGTGKDDIDTAYMIINDEIYTYADNYCSRYFGCFSETYTVPSVNSIVFGWSGDNIEEVEFEIWYRYVPESTGIRYWMDQSKDVWDDSQDHTTECPDGYIMTGFRIYSWNGNYDGWETSECVKMDNFPGLESASLGAREYQDSTQSSGNNNMHESLCNIQQGYVASGIKIRSNGHSEYMSIQCRKLTGANIGLPAWSPNKGPTTAETWKFHTATCPDGQLMTGIKAYSATHLREDLEVQCITPF